MAKAIALACLLLILSSTSAAFAIVCSPEAGSGRGWVWRQVEGKRCWYKGSRRTPIRLLSWKKEEKVPEHLKGTVIIAPQMKYKEVKVRRVDDDNPSFNERWWGDRR